MELALYKYAIIIVIVIVIIIIIIIIIIIVFSDSELGHHLFMPTLTYNQYSPEDVRCID